MTTNSLLSGPQHLVYAASVLVNWHFSVFTDVCVAVALENVDQVYLILLTEYALVRLT